MFFSSLAIECSHCPGVTGTYSDTFRYLESQFLLSNISNVQQNVFLPEKKQHTHKNPVLYIKGSNPAKCFLSIAPSSL